MKHLNFRTLLVFPIIAALIAAYYVLDPSASDHVSPQDRLTHAESTSPASRPPGEIAAREASSQTFVERVKSLNPEDFSSNPPMVGWEKEIVKVVRNLEMEDSAKVKLLLGMMPRLPHEGQVVALEQATAIIPDDDYVQLRPLILSYATTPELRETILHDVLTRSNTTRMPGLVELLRHPSYPAKTEIAEILSAYLDQDLGTDAVKWDLAVKKWIVENPDI